MSLRLVEQLPIKHEDAIVDIGAGESTLIDALLARGYHDLTALDAACAGPRPLPPDRRRAGDGRRDRHLGSRGHPHLASEAALPVVARPRGVPLPHRPGRPGDLP
jgi:hypothetical protein